MGATHSRKIAWVTGVNQGIGAQIRDTLWQQGIQVIGFDKYLDKVPAKFAQTTFQCDVSDPNHVEDLCEALISRYPPNYFVSVAGVLTLNSIEDTSDSELLSTFSVNVFGPYYFARKLMPHFKKQSNGSIVIVSSNASRVPRINMASYGASKAALSHFASTLALELAPYRVTVNTVSPGSTLTDMQSQLWSDEFGEKQTIEGNHANFKLGIPLQKIASPKDISESVAFLLSEQANHITMQELVIDGGATLGA